MGNSQSIDLIVDPANQSEITDVSVWLFFFSLKKLEGFVVYFQKIWTSVFQILECLLIKSQLLFSAWPFK